MLSHHLALKQTLLKHYVAGFDLFSVEFCHLLPYTQSVVLPGSLLEMKKHPHTPGPTLGLPEQNVYCHRTPSGSKAFHSLFCLFINKYQLVSTL